MIEQFCQSFLAALEVEQEALINVLVSGQCGGDRYHATAGRIAGIGLSANLMRDQLRTYLSPNRGKHIEDRNDNEDITVRVGQQEQKPSFTDSLRAERRRGTQSRAPAGDTERSAGLASGISDRAVQGHR